MNLLPDELIIEISQLDLPSIIKTWTWLTGDVKQVLAISKMGDLFFEGADARVYWVATDEGALTPIAQNVAEYEQLLKDELCVDEWFLPVLVAAAQDAGIRLQAGEVYGYEELPVLGGKYAIENLKAISVKAHFELTGLIHEQVKDLPDGTQIKITVTG